MYYRSVFALLLIAAALSCSVPEEVTLRVMTYNIYSNRNAGIEETARVISQAAPDIVALQEVERFTGINPGDVPARLAELTGMPYYYFIHALDIRRGGDYGNAILSRYPLTDTASYKLYGVGEKDYVRSLGYARVEKEGRSFYFAATHLDHKDDDASRLRMVSDIVVRLGELDAPVMLAGDFNARPDSRTLAALDESFELYGASGWQATVPVPLDETAKTIDYIVGMPHGAFGAQSYSAYYEAGEVSDHYPVVGDFILNF